jgi:hypothetical protein
LGTGARSRCFGGGISYVFRYQKRIGTDSLDHPNYLFALIHVVAPSEVIYDRLKKTTIKIYKLVRTNKKGERITRWIEQPLVAILCGERKNGEQYPITTAQTGGWYL